MKNEKKRARSFNFTFRYIDDVLSLNNSRFGDFVDRIYPIELEIKDTTDTDRSASYLDLYLEIDSEGWFLARIKEQVGEKRSTVCTHIYAYCLLQNTSTKHSKYVVNQNLEHIEDISF
jgi:ribosomal protein S24E